MREHFSLTKLNRTDRILQGIQRLTFSNSDQSQIRALKDKYASKSSHSCTNLASGDVPSTHSPSHSTSPARGHSSAPILLASTPVENLPSQSEIAIHTQGTNLDPATPSSIAPICVDINPHEGELFAEETIRLLAIKPMTPGISGDKIETSSVAPTSNIKHRANFDFWAEMSHEITLHIFANLRPKELVRASAVCKRFKKICYDGQLWTFLDASEFYKEIPSESLSRILEAAGPFVRDLNLRGCIQLEYDKRADVVLKSCHNLVTATLEGCRNFKRSSLHELFRLNGRLTNLNLTALEAVNNATCKIISQHCPCLEMLNISWCKQVDFRGINMLINDCKRLKDLRVGEILGLGALELVQDIFRTNNLERLVLSGCHDFSDQALKTMIHGRNPKIDVLTQIPLVPARRLRHLDMSRCHSITDAGIKALAHLTPNLQGLQLTGCTRLSDHGISGILEGVPCLTHLDLEGLFGLTNNVLLKLSQAPCAPLLERLSISCCDELGDAGMLPIFRACTSLKSVDMDNTKISDLVLAQAAVMVHSRSEITSARRTCSYISLRLVVYDCPNVTWAGIREVLSRNTEVQLPRDGGKSIHPAELVGLKCLYCWQMTVDEHTKRLLRRDLTGAGRLEILWRDWMMANEEIGTAGPGLRRRIRRAREAQIRHSIEEGGTLERSRRRRRAWSSGCTMM